MRPMRACLIAFCAAIATGSPSRAADPADVHRLVELLCPRPLPKRWDGWCKRTLVADGTAEYAFVREPNGIPRLQIIVDNVRFARETSKKARIVIDHRLHGRASMGMILNTRGEFFFRREGKATEGSEFKEIYQRLYDDFVRLGVHWLTKAPREKVVVLKAGRSCGYKTEKLAKRRFFLETC